MRFFSAALVALPLCVSAAASSPASHRTTAGVLATTATPLPAEPHAAPSLEPAPFNPAPSGSVFQFSKYKVVVGKPVGYFVHYTSNGRDVSGTLFSLGSADYVGAADLARFSAIWPLSVGKTVRYHRYDPRNSALSWADEISVLGTDTLQIGETRVDVYVVRWSSHSDTSRNKWEGTRTIWYAPALGWNVKFRSSDNQGASDADQVISYELAK